MSTFLETDLDTIAGLDALGVRLDGDLVRPGDPEWDFARQAWNLAVDQRPAAVVRTESAGTSSRPSTPPATSGCASPRRAPATTPRRSARSTTRSCSRPTAHARRPDRPRRRLARVEAGALWMDVVAVRASEHGLTALAGSAAGRRRRRLHPRRRPQLARRARSASPPTTSPRSRSSPPTAAPPRGRATTSPSCSGPCAAAAAASASSRRWSSGCSRVHRGVRRRAVLPDRARARGAARVARVAADGAGRGHVGRPDAAVPAAARAAAESLRGQSFVVVEATTCG